MAKSIRTPIAPFVTPAERFRARRPRRTTSYSVARRRVEKDIATLTALGYVRMIEGAFRASGKHLPQMLHTTILAILRDSLAKRAAEFGIGTA